MDADERRLNISAREAPPSIGVHLRPSAVSEGRFDGERLHLERARAELEDCLGKLPRDLPVRLAHRSWIAPLVFVGFVASGLFERPAAPEDVRIEQEAASDAREEGRALSDGTKVLGPLEGLDPDERGKVEKLRSNLEGTAEKLQKLADQTPREVLEELERRAREAEKLAESLGDGEGDILSPALVAELERHADTADLAAGFRSKDLGKIAKEAEKIAERLRKGVSIEERKRLEDALAKAMRAANARDARSLAGRSLAGAHQNLRQKRLAEAAKRFSKMAKQFSKARQRHLSRRQLQRLADRLRNAGQRIFNPGKSGPKRLRQSRYAAVPSLRRRKVLPVGSLPQGKRRAFGTMGRLGARTGRPPGSSGYAPVPGGAPRAGSQAGMGNVPVPGSGAGQAPMSGAGMGQPGAGMGQTPVPGAGMGQTPAPGAAGGQMASAGAMQGGLKAGHGSAPSMVRRIDAGTHAEEAARDFRQLAMRTIQDEEDALDEEPLPLSRREQILRYFTGLRRQIETETSSTAKTPRTPRTTQPGERHDVDGRGR
jgi:hypothetical protein